MSEYEGIYHHPCFGDIRVLADDGDRLLLEYGRFGKMVLVPETDLKFTGYFIDKLWFVTNSDGHTEPYHISFVMQDDKVTEIQYPIDFGEKPTSFLRGVGFRVVSSFSFTSLVTIGLLTVLTVS